MNAGEVLTLILVAGLAICLTCALLKPEWFS